ncbi:hypothetical protein SEA_BANTAM_166 [Gordonia phage Bantam]|uniref:Uncharacterized protein n=1 Tax=Gordonia phage Bantam TaxID=1887641 RepID=A0A1B3AYN1_9CAUD|nr:hypothetical protein BIZ77_gp013 [Gordonia phage Bantam]AOE43855.1 hypothetical protein SEA_BANTAM_166 [Gordonia phage Bantam]
MPTPVADFTLDRNNVSTRYNVLHLESVGRVQLWIDLGPEAAQRVRDLGIPTKLIGNFMFGHGKDVPAGMSATDAAEIMRRYIFAEIDHAEYSALLP